MEIPEKERDPDWGVEGSGNPEVKASDRRGLSPTVPPVSLDYRWCYYSLQYVAIIYNGHYCSGIFSGKTEKMAAGCDDFWGIFG